MPKQVQARAAQDGQEERKGRKLAGSLHAPADWKFHAQLVVLSWTGDAAWIRTQAEVNRTGAQSHPRAGQARATRPPFGTSRWDAGGPRRAGLSTMESGCGFPRRLTKLASRSNAARSGASICAKACAGAIPRGGEPAMIQTASQKNPGRLPLHRAARGVDDESRTDPPRASSATHLPSSARLVCHRASHQSSAGWTTGAGLRKPGSRERCVCAMARR
jgi:hypothetical protein